ncbi:type II toxin-antitoxin system HicA family toxin [Archaeoglobus veneficus]|uniref:YcfA family protein n=1 Tax=Archaeoglobus veneficus (strain DSM 11195 / SNP6) TaxID=693661 RepID=F2KQK3_ARCVS|nr:type II toxin-antitoxin system HicA family toxin [Archaeoglobus veneficus]AEA47736.1 YcfA family protein [Archaeoglobus veneficus SNP6]
MKLPRDLSGEELARLLRKYGYVVTRQTGSHMRLTRLEGEHHITIPKHRALKPGTLNSILRGVAEHLGVDKKELIKELFG